MGNGLFTLGGSISTTKTNIDCITIKAKNVVLNLNGNSITGPSNGASTESGVHVLNNATGAFVEGAGATISSFKYGIEDDSTNTVIDNVVASANSGTGIFLFKADGNSIDNVTAENNGSFGIWLSASSRNSVSDSVLSDNGNSGIEVGCINQSGKCTTVATGSTNNAIYDVTSNTNGGNGIEVQFQSGTNDIGLCSANGNTLSDMVDRHSSGGTTGCDSDVWFSNTFTTSNRPNCIQ